MIAETAQAAVDAAKQSGVGTETLIGLAILIVSNIGLWLDKFVQMSRNRAEREQAEADEAEAKAAAAVAKPANGNGAAIHEKYVLPHSLELQRHDGELKAIVERFNQFEKRNVADHDKIFDKLDDIRDLVVGKAAGAA